MEGFVYTLNEMEQKYKELEKKLLDKDIIADKNRYTELSKEFDNIQKILFRDAVFSMDIERTETLCEIIIDSNMKFEWWCETRVDRLNESLLVKMKKAGCKGINVGIETGDSSVMEKCAKVGLTLERLNMINAIAKDIGINLHFLFLSHAQTIDKGFCLRVEQKYSVP